MAIRVNFPSRVVSHSKKEALVPTYMYSSLTALAPCSQLFMLFVTSTKKLKRIKMKKKWQYNTLIYVRKRQKRQNNPCIL